MKNTDRSSKKRMYISPAIDLIKLDNEISLALESTPPVGPDESKNHITPEYNNTAPYNNFT